MNPEASNPASHNQEELAGEEAVVDGTTAITARNHHQQDQHVVDEKNETHTKDSCRTEAGMATTRRIVALEPVTIRGPRMENVHDGDSDHHNQEVHDDIADFGEGFPLDTTSSKAFAATVTDTGAEAAESLTKNTQAHI